MLPLLLAVGGVYLLTSARGSKSPQRADDLEALTRMLIAETSFTMPQSEMAGIVQVALNRARKWNVPASWVVEPSGIPGRVAWNTGSAYRKRFDDAVQSPRWESAKAFVQRVAAGQFKNSGYTGFVHPERMPAPPCSNANHTVVDTFAGKRCIPVWAQAGTTVGKTLFA